MLETRERSGRVAVVKTGRGEIVLEDNGEFWLPGGGNVQRGKIVLLPPGFTITEHEAGKLERALVLLYSVERLNEEQVRALLGGASFVDLERLRKRVVKEAQALVVSETMKNGDTVTFGIGNGFRPIPDVSEYRWAVLLLSLMAAAVGSFVGYVFGSW